MHGGHWIEEFFNSISSTLPISNTALLDSLLNTILTFVRSSRIQVFVRTNFHSFDFLSIRVLVRERIGGDLFFTKMSKDVYQSPGCQFHSCDVFFFFVSSRTSGLLSPVACCFHMLVTSCSRTSCYCCCCCCWGACQLLFNVTLRAGLGVASLSDITRSPF